MKEKNKLKKIDGDIIFSTFIYALLWVALLAILYPLIYIVSSSFSSPVAVATGRVFLFPVEPSLMSYETVFKSDRVFSGYRRSFEYAIIGTSINVIMTMIAAYPLSRKNFYGRNLIMFAFTFTMLFSGGLIPTYLVVRNLGMIDTRWAMVIPNAVNVWFIIITRTYIQSNIPEEMFESASIDGISHTRFLFKFIFPLSKPIIAVLVLMYAVGHWNTFFNAMIFLHSPDKHPLQLVLRQILLLNQEDVTALNRMATKDMQVRRYLAESLKYSLIIVASVPLLIIYPFIQKYFIKGIMIGSIKG